MSSVAADPHAVHAHAQHHPSLAHQFDNLDQQRESSTLGMWIFLVTEIMFFGGLFTAYVIYRSQFSAAFQAASHHLNVIMGGANTAVLILSSLTMAMAIWAAQVNRRKLIVVFLILTMLLGATFLGVKYFEYKEKFTHHLVPGPNFEFDGPDPQHAQIFFSLYFIMTGLHALHMIIGIGVLTWLAVLSWKGRFNSEYHNPLECAGLYWHFVDIVWIFLFPLLYLLGAHAH